MDCQGGNCLPKLVFSGHVADGPGKALSCPDELGEVFFLDEAGRSNPGKHDIDSPHGQNLVIYDGRCMGQDFPDPSPRWPHDMGSNVGDAPSGEVRLGRNRLRGIIRSVDAANKKCQR